MKKFFKVFLTLVLLSGMGYLGFKYLYKTRSLLGRIHIDADSALRIGLHDIKETLVLDALTSPMQYFEELSFSRKDSTDSTVDKGFDLRPYNVVFFSVPSIKNTFFTVVPIRDLPAFQNYISTELRQKSLAVERDSTNQYWYALAPKHKLAMAWNEAQWVVAIAPAPKINRFHDVFLDILRDNKTIQEKNHPLIETLAEANDHITYLNKESKVTLNFEDGQALLKGLLYTEQPGQFPKQTIFKTVPDASLSLKLDGNFKNVANKTKVLDWAAHNDLFEKIDLKAADIIDRTNGLLSVSINGKVKQTDTIITYDYDDNFEKIEKKTVQEKEVPRVHISLGGDGQGLGNYLQAQQALTATGVLKALPLYSFYVKEDGKATSFDTFQEKVTVVPRPTSNFFECHLDFKSLKDHVEIPRTKKYFNALKTLEIKARQRDGNQVAINGTISGYRPEINIISQVFFMLDTNKDR